MLSLRVPPTLRTLLTSGRGYSLARYSMASSAENVSRNGTAGEKRHAETPLRSEEKSRGSYRFKSKRMKNGHATSSQILKTNGTNEEILLEDVKTLLKGLELEKKTEADRKSTRLNSSHSGESRMPSSA